TNQGVANEFSSSNVAGTIAMAQSTGPNSATNQFFFNLVDNSAALDRQLFTVFGKVVGVSDQTVLNTLGQTPVHDESGTSFATANPPKETFGQMPINPASYATNSLNFPADTTAANYILVNGVTVQRQNESLTYAVTSSDNNIATAALVNNTSELVRVQGVGQGTATITVTATDQFGNSKATTFKVTVP